jgi:hypothetical protein
MVVRIAMIKGAGLDFIKEMAIAARQPEINVMGTRLLLIIPTRLLVLALNPASVVFATLKASGVHARKARTKKHNILICSVYVELLWGNFGSVFIADSPFVDEC